MAMLGLAVAWPALAFLWEAAAHKPMVNGASCGQFSSPAEALQLPRETSYWGVHRVVTCDAPVLWVNMSLSADRTMEITVGSLHPSSSEASAERYKDLRADVLMLGGGLPALNTSGLEIEVPPEFATGLLLQSPSDVSSCGHSETLFPEYPSYTGVENGLCYFADTFGTSSIYGSLLLDKKVQVAAGNSSIAIWFRGLRTGKMWVMLGSNPVAGPPAAEDLYGGDEIPIGTCDCVGSMTPDSADVFSGGVDFWELEGDSDAAVPLVVQCGMSSHQKSSYCNPMANDGKEHNMSQHNMSGHNMSGHNMTGHDMTGGDEDDEDTGMIMCHGGMSGHHMLMGCGECCPIRQKLEGANMLMHRGMAIEFTCNTALDFVRGMIPHHQGAVDMCSKLQASVTSIDSGLAHFCYHVNLEQSWEVAGMERWLNRTGASPATLCTDGSMGCGDLSCESSRAFLAANMKMHSAMAIKFSCDAELDFVQGMIPHHQGAVEMCAVLQASSSEDAYLEELCANITKLQNAEMIWMHGWLQARNQSLGASCSGMAVTEPCFDMLPISDLCHDLGGDGLCSCSNLLSYCGTEHTVQGRVFWVNEVCARTCGRCSEPELSAQEILSELLADHSGHSSSTTNSSVSVSAASARSAQLASAYLLALSSLLLWAKEVFVADDE